MTGKLELYIKSTDQIWSLGLFPTVFACLKTFPSQDDDDDDDDDYDEDDEDDEEDDDDDDDDLSPDPKGTRYSK